MMTGSCVLSDQYWIKSITILFGLINELKKKLNIDIDFMNIGGGIGIPYKPTEKKVDIALLAKKIRNLFDEKIKQYNIKEPTLHMENGRFITGPYGYLISRCHVIKNSYETYYGLDACMANLMRPGMYGSYHHISVPRLKNSPDLLKANVVGTLCENNDWFARDRPLPVGIRKGDLFVIHDTGAHSHSMGFQYNGKLRAPEILLGNDEKTYLIRKRETIEDLFSNCIDFNMSA
jgi:diaminopimelate decarboxylase